MQVRIVALHFMLALDEELEASISVYKEMYTAMSEKDPADSQLSIARKKQQELEKQLQNSQEMLNETFHKFQLVEGDMNRVKSNMDKVKSS